MIRHGREETTSEDQPAEKPIFGASPRNLEKQKRFAAVLTYRVATIEDAPALAQMNHQLIRDEGHRNSMTPEQLAQRMELWLAGEYTAVLFEAAGQAAAYALFREEADSVYIRQFFVRRELRRRGIGRAAMRVLLQNHLRSAQRITLEVLNGNYVAREFWRAVGFRDYAVTMEFHAPAPMKPHEDHG